MKGDFVSNIIGIDLGTACGWALLSPDGARLASGEWDLRSRRHEGGGMRFLRFSRLLTELLEGQQVEAVAYEEVQRHLGTDAAHVYGGLVAHLQTVCEVKGIPYTGIPVGTVKKQATGKGNAGKEAMVEAARGAWPGLAPNLGDNEADALWVAESWRRGHG